MAYGLRQVATRRALDPHLTVDPAHTSFVRECHHPHHTHDTQPRPRRHTRHHRAGLHHSPVTRGARGVALCVRRGVRTWRAGVSARLRLQRWTASASLACGGMRACVAPVRCAHSGAHTQTLVYTPVYALAYRYVVSASMNGVTGQRRRRHAALAPAPQHTIIMPPCPMPNGRGGARQVVHAATAAARRLNQ